MSEALDAPQTGASEAASATPAPAGKTETVNDAVERAFRAMETAEAATPGETEQAAAVLKNGSGADEKLVGDAQKQAARAVEKAEAEAKRQRDETGKFASREPKPEPQKAEAPKEPVAEPQKAEGQFAQPPARLNAEAKAAWAQAPEALRAEVTRALSETEQGIAKYREGAENWSKLADFDRMAKQLGTDIPTALKNYVDADMKISADPVAGIRDVLKARGIDLMDFARHVANMDPDQVERGERESAMQREIASLRQQLGQITGTIQQSQQSVMQRVMSEVEADVAQFRSQKPRFAELEPDIGRIITAGLVTGTDRLTVLQQAYDMAERLKPAPQPPVVNNPDPAAQTRKTDLSLASANAGSNPVASRPRARSTDEAVERAFAASGL